MKVLFCNILDSTLYCLVVTSVSYDPLRKELRFEGGGNIVKIPNIPAIRATAIIGHQFYGDNRLDLRSYPAYINEEPLVTNEER